MSKEIRDMLHQYIRTAAKMENQLSISEVLASLAHEPISYRDGEILLSHALSTSREAILAHSERLLTEAEFATFTGYLARRKENEPVAYITGVKEFYGRTFRCDSRALIPRPETEGIVHIALPWLTAAFKAQSKPCPLRILELGTGCGALCTTIAAELISAGVAASILATDIDEGALNLARENYNLLAGEHAYVSTKFITADLLNSQQIHYSAPFDCIVMNLPYVEDTWKHNPEAQKDVVFFEPGVALFGGSDGLDLYRKTFPDLPPLLSAHFLVLAEHGDTQGEAMRNLAAITCKEAGVQVTIKTHGDYAGLDRIVSITSVPTSE